MKLSEVAFGLLCKFDSYGIKSYRIAPNVPTYYNEDHSDKLLSVGSIAMLF